MNLKRIIVIGAGPAGMMAAIKGAQLYADVTLIEKNPTPGRKLLLSGKGRCNITNSCDLDAFLERFSKNGAFLRDAFRKFFNLDLIQFFEDRGLRLKTERQLRVFPLSDRSSGVLEVLKRELEKNKVKVIYDTHIDDVLVLDKQARGVRIKGKGEMLADKVILACGGISYSFTGSTGDGIKIAERLGHQIVALRPGLVPLEAKQEYPRLLQGLTLKNIRINFCAEGKHELSDIGELLFTDYGVSGPLILSQSGRIVDWLRENKKVYLEIDLKPALSIEQLRARFFRELTQSPKKNLRNILKEMLPLKMIDLFIRISKIDPRKQASQISRDEREALLSLLKGWRLDITRSRPIEEAMITRGGVSLKEINPRTMESRLIKGLYFSGEMIDLDADTGGFNLQEAFSTGYLAGESAAKSATA